MENRKPDIYMLGNGHLDPIWLWQLPEGLAEIKATFRSALDRMKEFEGYIFTSACASYYAWVEHNEPAMFEEIKARIAEGRWAIAGGMWVQPDCNIPAGESFARHLLHSQRYFREKFGKIARVGYNVDSFGHNGMFPQLLSKAGMVGYIFRRPDSNLEMPSLPEDLFLWESPDGTRLPTYRTPFGYGDSAFKLDAYRELIEKYQVPYLAFYGVGNHGGGPTIRKLQEIESVKDETMVYSGPEAYFDRVIADGIPEKLRVIKEDLQHHASGCYSANSKVKKLNRFAESALLSAEKYDMLCQHLLVAAPAQHDKLTAAWKKLMFFQFHDVLAGCCVRDAMEEAEYSFGSVIDRAEESSQFALEKLSWNINTHRTDSRNPAQKLLWTCWEKEGEGAPVVVFNPHGFPVKRPVALSASQKTDFKAVCDSEGNFVPVQKVRARFMNYAYKEDFMFMAELPAYGYRTYYVYRQQEGEATVKDAPIAKEFVLENKNLRVEFNREYGWIEKLTDKRTGKVTNSGPLGRAVLVEDSQNDTWAHKVFSFTGQVGQFGSARFQILDNGPNRAGIRVVSSFGASTLTQDYYLYEDSDAVEVDCRLFFAERLKFLRLCFPAAVEQPMATFAMPYGFLNKTPDGKENPSQCWASVRDEKQGIAVLSDCKYSFSVMDNELRMVIARSCGYADHYGVRDGLEEYQDLGEQRFGYMIYPHGKLSHGQVQRHLGVLQQKIRWIQETFHDGPLAPTASGVSDLPENVMLEAVKQPEAGAGFVARFYETDGKETDLTVTLLGREAKLHFGPHEIKTVCFPANGAPVETNLLEDYE